ncbi:MAG: hypothetical protein CTY34_09715 [Methylobacter sp.]|nr:MAG: hypothetical protein CTY34_09715 [Methylobacter sp.]PPD03557.1 MAG: hypothetical protein CTY29_09140 [Methylobacter sp.]PPD20836.1 MAG: hypothetical protein CTY24_08655 [Methylobacter sp.]PPD36541.1 MAG: hypothetical protein CTY18_03990 [Methylomonas sp.]
MASCKEVSALISKALDKRLGLRNLVKVKLHLRICGGCTNFQKQADFMQKAAKQFRQRLTDNS